MPLFSQSPARSNAHRCEEDHYLYRFIASRLDSDSDRSLAFIGFLRTAGAPIVYEAQALWATAYLAGSLDLLGQDEQEREIAWTNNWIRRHYVCGRKVPFALFDFLPVMGSYLNLIDEAHCGMQYVYMLYHDLGVRTRRKANIFAEIFGVYQPRDFAGVVAEWQANHGMNTISHVLL